MIKKTLFVVISSLVSVLSVLAQDDYKAVSKYDYYTDESSVVIAVWVPESKVSLDLSTDIVFEFEHLVQAGKLDAGGYNLFEFPVELFNHGANEITVSYNEHGKWVGSDKINIILREDQFNAVKIDRLSGGLVVEGLPFIPFGFYAYSPVQPGIAEEEVVKGFNMMSPYQLIEGKTLKDRKAYMDRCAALGMKVNYNLLSLAGGGGVAQKKYEKLSHRKRIKLLREEIESFRDHPALLSWYISDEPVGQGVPPDSLVEAYQLIKELDPYHPVTIVFMTPWIAKDYSHVMDIVMADPYPIPDGQVDEVGAVAAQLSSEFFMEKPVWIVPQAFGGNEWWEREPTPQELRSMTYLSFINNARGIQYFIRHGLNSFPKSTIAWNECGAMALEIAELTPYFYSYEKVPEIVSKDVDIQLKGFLKDGSFLVIVVNTANKPREFSFKIEDFKYSGSAAVLFENRSVGVIEGEVSDIIDAYGSRVYKITYKLGTSKGPKVHNKNILKDPSFENITGTGIPASCYARPKGDRGATYFIDSRTSVRGDHSLRLSTPEYAEGMELSFMRMRLEPGQSYTMSVQARALPLKYREEIGRSFFNKLCGCGQNEYDMPEFIMKLGQECEKEFTPGTDWKEFSFSCVPTLEAGEAEISPVLELVGKGTAWFDLLQVYPDMRLKSFVRRDDNDISISISSTHKKTQIFYTLDNSIPDTGSIRYKGTIKLKESATLKAAAFRDGQRLGYIEKPFVVHLATGRYVEYKHKYSSKYDSGLKNGLVDGILASTDFKDGKWQGFEGDDLDVIINLKEVRELEEVSFRFLKNSTAWIFLPEEVKILYSVDGVEYEDFPAIEIIDPRANDAVYIRKYIAPLNGINARYVRIVARNIGTCPPGHAGEGGKAWLFCDEIIVK